MAKKTAAEKRMEAVVGERIDGLVGKVPATRKRKKLFGAACDAELAVKNDKIAVAAQKQLEADDAFNEAFAAAMAYEICMNG